MDDPRCIACKTEVDPDEFGNPEDADICGYCFAAALSIARCEHPSWTEHELGALADLRIRQVHAPHTATPGRLIRLLEAYK